MPVGTLALVLTGAVAIAATAVPGEVTEPETAAAWPSQSAADAARDGVDPDGHVELDPARMLHGDEADAAYAAETGDGSGAPNDYAIDDLDHTTVTYPVAGDVGIRMTSYWDHGDGGDVSSPLPWREFARIWAADAETVSGR